MARAASSAGTRAPTRRAAGDGRPQLAGVLAASGPRPLAGRRDAPRDVGPPLSSVEGEECSYPIAAVPGETVPEPRGPWALPGTYTVR